MKSTSQRKKLFFAHSVPSPRKEDCHHFAIIATTAIAPLVQERLFWHHSRMSIDDISVNFYIKLKLTIILSLKRKALQFYLNKKMKRRYHSTFPLINARKPTRKRIATPKRERGRLNISTREGLARKQNLNPQNPLEVWHVDIWTFGYFNYFILVSSSPVILLYYNKILYCDLWKLTVSRCGADFWPFRMLTLRRLLNVELSMDKGQATMMEPRMGHVPLRQCDVWILICPYVCFQQVDALYLHTCE